MVHARTAGGGVFMILSAVVIGPLTSYPCGACAEHVGLSPDLTRSQSPSARHCDVVEESHKA